MAIDQCRTFIQRHNLSVTISSDTAAAARAVASEQNEKQAAICSRLAADLNGLKILHQNVEDLDSNTTRFLELSKSPNMEPAGIDNPVTTLIFEVRNIPSALFKVLSGFATNNINLTKLESYQSAEDFRATRFYVDVESATDQTSYINAKDDLDHYSTWVRWLGTYSRNRI